jgi:hypothetical protein
MVGCHSCVSEDLSALVLQVLPVSRHQPRYSKLLCQGQQLPRLAGQRVRNDASTIVTECYPPAVKQCIQSRRQQEPIEYIQSLSVGSATRPWFDVGSPQELRHGQAGNAASSAPKFKQRVAEHLLSDLLVSEQYGPAVSNQF